MANALLNALTPDERERLSPHFRTVGLPCGKTVGDTRRYLYFPSECIVSVMMFSSDGDTGEITSIGEEGMFDVSCLLGKSQGWDHLVQFPGEATRIPAAPVLTEFQRGKAFQQNIMRFHLLLTAQIAQTALCNRHHTIEQQVARWLLVNIDRQPRSEITVTQGTIANMLGVRREGVTLAVGKLARAGIIECHRGRIQVLDRDRLHDHSCECFDVVKHQYHAGDLQGRIPG